VRKTPTPDSGPSRLDWLALSCFLIWSAGAGLTHVLGIWAAIGGAAVGLGIATLVLARPVIVPLLRPSRPLLVWSVVATFVMVSATYGLYPMARQLSPDLGRAAGGLYAIFRAAGPLWIRWLLLPFIIVAEELIWRGAVQEALGRRVSPAAAVLLGAVAYAVAHAPEGSLLLIALALACGLFWSALRVTTRSLIPGLISHLIWDLLVFILLPLA
jgi:membrane protease YdiL (CAAX protease family)